MVTQATLTNYANELLNIYVANWENKYGKSPEINRYKVRWGFQDMATDLGIGRARKVIDFYFTTEKLNHPLQYLLYNYERLDRIMREVEKDEIDREELRRETEKRVKEWLDGNK